MFRLILLVPCACWLVAACSLGFDGADLQTGASTVGVGATGGNGPGGATTTSSTGGTEPAREICANLSDDDDDGLVDCEDPDCVCMRVPDGWKGPVTLHTDPNAGCHAGESKLARGGIEPSTVLDAVCSDCSCDPAQNSCIADVYIYDDPTCAIYFLDFPGNGCNNQPTGAVQGIRGGAIQNTSGGACPHSGGVATLPPVTWSQPALICEPAGGGLGCNPRQACFGTSATASERSCILMDGEQSCPPEFPVELPFTAVANDTRRCTDCTCSAPTGAVCGVGTVTYYSLDGCMGPTLGTFPFNTCTAPTGSIESAELTVTNPGTCTKMGGSPTGAVSFNHATLCCLPTM